MSETPMEEFGLATWDKTSLAIENIKDSGLYEEAAKESPHGYFKGRHIIGRDTPIQGGVYIGAGDREAIVVDDTNNLSELDKIYKLLIQKREEIVAEGGSFTKGILEDVFTTVQQVLLLDKQKVQEINNTLNLNHNEKVTLDTYIRNKAGVCRHQALLGGYILERLAKEGYIKGQVSIDRNFIPGKGGHAWIRYTSGEGRVVILDPARNFIGYLDTVGKGAGWSYERPSPPSGFRALFARATK